MDTTQEKPEQILNEARAAFKIKDYPLSLEHYEWFFDHSLDEPYVGYASVRLSYCLLEWIKLGEVFDPARISLERRRLESIADLERTRQPVKFHEFVAICELTGARNLAVGQFLHYHQSDKALAKLIFGFIKSKLIEQEQWEVCGDYIDDPDREYAIALQVYDGSHRLAQKDPSLGEDFVQVYKNRYLSEASGLIAVLTHNRRFDEAQRICERANQDMRERGLTEFLSVYPEDFED
ncbi:hypothetical protein [Undibacterium terreum]|nr:hypothetical protein [Undibacterium terreum]